MALNTPYYLSNKGKSNYHKNKGAKAGSEAATAGIVAGVAHGATHAVSEATEIHPSGVKMIGTAAGVYAAGKGIQAGYHANEAHKYGKAARMTAAHKVDRTSSHAGIDTK